MKLHLADTPEPSRQEIAMARIEQSAREYRNDQNQPWTPVELPRERRPLLRVDEVVTYKVIDVAAPLPLTRRLLRWLKRLP